MLADVDARARTWKKISLTAGLLTKSHGSPPFVGPVLHERGSEDSVASAVGGHVQRLGVIASSDVVVVAVEILRLVKLLLASVRLLGQQGLHLVCLLLLAAVEPLVCRISND